MISGVATGSKRGNLPSPPPQPPIGHPVRSMQLRDFHVGKMGVGLQDLLPHFTSTDATEDVVWSCKEGKEREL